MKAKFNFKRKRTIITIAIIAVVATVASVAGYYFMKGNNTAGATNDGEKTSETTSNEQYETPVESEQENQNNQENPDQTIESGTEEEEGITGNVITRKTDITTGDVTEGEATTDDTETDATLTYEEVRENIVVEKPWETHMVEWTPETLNVSTASVETSKKNLLIEKKATISTGYTLVNPGEIITYSIKLTNNQYEVLNSLYISDVIPEGATFEEIDERGTTIVNEDNVVTRVVWNLWDLGLKQNESIEVSFSVKVAEDAKGTIKNIAIAESEESNPVVTPILEKFKTSVIKRGKEIVPEPARCNDEITYTISVNNTGDVAGTTLIKDSDLKEKVLSDEKANLVSEIKVYEQKDKTETEKATLTLDQLAVEGYEVEIGANTTIKVVYTVKLNKISGKVLNKATIGNKDTETDEVETIGIDVEKEVVDILRFENKEYVSVGKDATAKVGDKIQYEITVTNMGSIKLVNVNVEEKLKGIEITSGNLKIGKLEPGESTTLTAEYEVTSERDIIGKLDRKVVNVVKVTGEEERNHGKDPEKVEDIDEVETPVEKVVGLTVEKKVSIDNKDFKEKVSIGNGEIAYYKIYLKNTSNITLKITAEDTLKLVKADNTNFTEILKLYTDSKHKTEFTEVELKPEEELTIYASKSIDQTIVNEVNSIENTIKVKGEEVNPKEGETPEVIEKEDKAEVEVKKPKITSTKTSYVKDSEGNKIKETSDANPMKVEPGEIITYEVKIKNNGETTGDTEIKDYLPSEVTLQGKPTIVEGNKYTTVKVTEENKDGETVKVVTITVKELSNEKGKNVVKVLINTRANDITDEQAKVGVTVENEIYTDGNEEPTDKTTDTITKPVIDAEKSSTYITTAVTENEESTTKKVHVGDEITYTMKVTNSGLVEEEGLTIEDIIPEGVKIKQGTITAKLVKIENETKIKDLSAPIVKTRENRTVVVLDNISLGANERVILKVTVIVEDLGVGVYSANIENNTVEVKKDNNTIREGEDPKDYEVVEANITVKKEVKSADELKDLHKETVTPETEIKYLITAKNENGTEAKEVTITDKLDTTNLIDISAKVEVTRAGKTAEASKTVDVTDGKISYTDTINPGDVIIIKISAKTRALKENEISYKVNNTAKYVVDAQEKSTDSVTVDVKGTISATITKKITAINNNSEDIAGKEVYDEEKSTNTYPGITAKSGDQIQYSIVAKNTGDVILSKVNITDNRNVNVTKIIINNEEQILINSDKDGKRIVSKDKNLLSVLKDYDSETGISMESFDEIEVVVTYTINDTTDVIDNKTLINKAYLDTNQTEKQESTAKIDMQEIIMLDIEKVVTKNGTEKVELSEATQKDNDSTHILDYKNVKVELGDKLTYKITATNKGNVTLEDVKITDTRKVTVTEIKIAGESKKLKDSASDREIKSGINLLSALKTSVTTLKPGTDKSIVITVQYTTNKTDDFQNQPDNYELINETNIEATPKGREEQEKDSAKAIVYEEERIAEIEYEKKSTVYRDGKEVKNARCVKAGDQIVYKVLVKNTDAKITAKNIKITDDLKENKISDIVTLDKNSVKVTVGKEDSKSIAQISDTKIEYTISELSPKTTAYIEFTVTVNNNVDKADLIGNTAKITYDNEDPKPTKDPKEYPVKVPEITAKQIGTEVSGINVVLVMDLSGSMNYTMSMNNASSTDSRLFFARKQAKEFITSIFNDEYADGLNQVSVVGFNYTAGGNSDPTKLMEGAASVVRFSSDKTVATTVNEAKKLAEKVETLTAGGGTDVYASLVKAKAQVEALKAKKPNNKNILVFLGDGAPSEFIITETLDSYEFTQNEEEANHYYHNYESQIVSKANEIKQIKNSEGKATEIYTIGFGLESLTGKRNVECSSKNCTKNHKHVQKDGRDYVFDDHTYYKEESESIYAKRILKNIATSNNHYKTAENSKELNKVLTEINESLKVAIPEVSEIKDGIVTITMTDTFDVTSVKINDIAISTTTDSKGCKYSISGNKITIVLGKYMKEDSLTITYNVKYSN